MNLKSFVVKAAAVSLLAFSLTAAAGKPDRDTLKDVAIEVNGALDVFNTLIFALVAEGDLLNRVDGKGQYTVFAPTDEAFTNLEDNILPLYCFNNVLELFGDQPGYISDVLNYHVAKGRRDSTEVLPASRIRMLTGEFVTRDPGSLILTDALGFDAELQLVTKGVPSIDVPASNGIIHTIDRVLLPYEPVSNCP